MKKRTTTFDVVMTIFFGWLGYWKFRNGKVGLGILWIFTAGAFYIGWIYDIAQAVKAASADKKHMAMPYQQQVYQQLNQTTKKGMSVIEKLLLTGGCAFWALVIIAGVSGSKAPATDTSASVPESNQTDAVETTSTTILSSKVTTSDTATSTTTITTSATTSEMATTTTTPTTTTTSASTTTKETTTTAKATTTTTKATTTTSKLTTTMTTTPTTTTELTTTTTTQTHPIVRKYWINHDSKIVHSTSCYTIPDDKDNYWEYIENLDINWAEANGYRACKKCEPIWHN